MESQFKYLILLFYLSLVNPLKLQMDSYYSKLEYGATVGGRLLGEQKARSEVDCAIRWVISAVLIPVLLL